MKLAHVKDRHFVNQIIATAVLLHLVTVMLAARFELLWLTQLMLAYALILYFVLGPIFWLWHRAIGRATKVEQLDDIRQVFATGEQVYRYDPRKYFKPKVCSPA